MLKASHNRFFSNFYSFYARKAIQKHFSSVNIDVPPIELQKPVLLIGNHHAWWDGFWMLELNNRYWKKRFYVMMLYAQLKKHPTFCKAGAFSVDHGKKSVIETIAYSQHLLEDAQNLVLVYPQGKIQSQHINFIKFRKGVLKLIANSEHCNIMMIATFTDYLSQKKNGLWVYGRLLTDLSSAEAAYNTFYQESKKQQQQWTG